MFGSGPVKLCFEPGMKPALLSTGRLYRGSRKHVLDWTSSPAFAVELMQLLRPVSIRLSADSDWMPRGYEAPDEAVLDRFGPRVMPRSESWAALKHWWLTHAHGANTPNWDIAVACELEGRPGLILVEAKANKTELKIEGKLLAEKPSDNSRENHDRIGLAIEEACIGLRTIDRSVAINRDRCYQLSNRLAFAWKLASLGIPSVLVYLGFLGDSGISDVGPPLVDSSDWRQTFAEHAKGVVPLDLFERRLSVAGAFTWFLLRERAIREVSPRAAA
jgi:hypothetical protein